MFRVANARTHLVWLSTRYSRPFLPRKSPSLRQSHASLTILIPCVAPPCVNTTSHSPTRSGDTPKRSVRTRVRVRSMASEVATPEVDAECGLLKRLDCKELVKLSSGVFGMGGEAA